MTEAASGAVILAAGKGTRMKSEKAKVLHEVFYQPMVRHVIGAVLEAGVLRGVCVIGHQKEAVAQALDGLPVECVVQAEQKGTGHAVLCAREACSGLAQILIVCGDTPLLRAETLQAMQDQHRESGATLTLMTTELDNPFGYGRILRGPDNELMAIVEEKDASPEERQIREINAGVYLVRADFLFQALSQVGTDNRQGEMYLTDIAAIARREGKKVQPFLHPVAQDVLGVNSRVELAQAEAVLQARRNRELMLSGVTMLHPPSTRVAPDCELGRDCLLHAQTTVEDGSRLGPGCVLDQGAILRNCTVGAGARIGAYSVLENRQIADGELVAPLSRGL